MAETEGMTAQELVFEVMKKASFNAFDAEEVVTSLKEHKDLWSAVWMGREICDLLPLRDIGYDHIALDTLYIVPSGEGDKKLMKLAKDEWGADEVGVLPAKEAGKRLGEMPTERRVIRVWWD